ncbi:MAG: AAA family ATPase [Nanoarchaeota archaeon]
MSSPVSELFTEKFRPKNLAQLIAPERVKKELARGLVQNLLLYGSAGTGKTSTLFILAKDHKYLYINASSERGIDIIREKISRFAASNDIIGGEKKLKCVILDELDGATDEFFKALRAVMEKYAKTTRFIASCNYIQKVPDPVISRFHDISYDPVNNKEENYLIEVYKKRVKVILDAAKISYTDDIIDKFIRLYFPDMRKVMSKLQGFYLRGVKSLDDNTFNTSFDFKDLFNQCLKKPDKPYENYKELVGAYATRVDEALGALGTTFPTYLKANVPDKIDKLPMVLIAVAEYQYQKSFVIDPMITLLAAVYKIQTILS